MENKCGAHSVFICMETIRDTTDSYVLNTWLDTVKCQKAEVKTGSRSPYRLSEHIDFLKIWLSESMSKKQHVSSDSGRHRCISVLALKGLQLTREESSRPPGWGPNML